MSRESDALDCLADAIDHQTGGRPSPGDFNTKTPDSLLYADGAAWLVSLKRAASCLRDKGYQVQEPVTAKAKTLRTKMLVDSQAYLVALITG